MKNVFLKGLFIFAIMVLSSTSIRAYWCSSTDTGGYYDVCYGPYDCGCDCPAGKKLQGCESGRSYRVICNYVRSSPCIAEPYACYYDYDNANGQYCYPYGSNGACECEPSHPSCDNCTLPLCEAPLTATGDADLKLSNYRTCRNSDSQCTGDSKYGDCYEPNTKRSQPVRDSFYIYGSPTFDPKYALLTLPDFITTRLGFKSITVTGGTSGANQPFVVDTTFRDSDGVEDIETMGVWFRDTAITAQYPNEVGTPYYIDTNDDSGLVGKSFGNNTWGFLMHKEGTSPNETWVPYVIAANPDGVNHKWVKAFKYPNNGGFAIPANDGLVVVRIGGLNITATGSPEITNADLFTKRLRFTVMPNTTTRNVSYDIYTISHDKFSFTPYDNYLPTSTNILSYWNQEEIRNNTRVRDVGEPNYARQWVDTVSNWRIDNQAPGFSPLTSTTSGTNVTLSWRNVIDSATSPNLVSGIYGVVVNIYRGSGTEVEQTVTINSTISYNPPPLPSVPDNVAGNLALNSSAYQNISSSASGSINIGLANFTKGSLIIYVTIFDNGGNIARQNVSLDLSDWVITQGDLFYSSLGTNFDVKAVTPSTAWNGTKLENLFSPIKADISSELYAVGNNDDSKLISTSNKSYAIKNFSNTLPSAIYETYLKSFKERKSGIANLQEIGVVTTMAGSLGPSYCNIAYPCYGEFNTLTINQSFVCNGKAIFFVSGNLTINPSITNTNPDRDACMFVVGGNVTIRGGSVPVAPNIYDEINAFIVADGTITIQNDAHSDGLLVKGGLISTSTTANPSIIISRSLPLSLKSTFPVLAVSAHPKYPPLSKIFIGTPINLSITEVGFKGY